MAIYEIGSLLSFMLGKVVHAIRIFWSFILSAIADNVQEQNTA